MNEPGNVELKLIHMEDVVSKEVEWLWYPYIPYGSIFIYLWMESGMSIFMNAKWSA